MMRRREFIAVLGGAVAWPVGAFAQPGKLPTIGFLGADEAAFSLWTAAFVARLRELGWIEGRTIAIEYRWSQGRSERYAEIAAEFVRLNVDAIVTVGSAVPIVKQATSAIPIVFAVGIDPVGNQRNQKAQQQCPEQAGFGMFERHTFSTSFLPSRPEGLTSRIKIRTANAMASR